MVKHFGQGNDQKGFQWAMVVYGVLAIGLFLFTFLTTRERVQPTKSENSVLKDDLRDLGRNIPWVMVCFIGVFAVFYISIRMGAILYYFKYCVVRAGEQYHLDLNFLGYRLKQDMSPEALAHGSWQLAQRE